MSKELRDIGQRIIADAGQWGSIDDSDLEQLPETMIDISLAQFELWLAGERLRGVHAKAVRNTLSQITQNWALAKTAWRH